MESGGLFGYILGPTVIKNLTLENVDITVNLSQWYYGGVGGLVGYENGCGGGCPSISNCHVSGSIQTVGNLPSASPGLSIGGIIGIDGNTPVTASSFSGSISAMTGTENVYVGGLAGTLMSSISNSTANAQIGSSGLGAGLAAFFDGDAFSILGSTASGSVTAQTPGAITSNDAYILAEWPTLLAGTTSTSTLTYLDPATAPPPINNKAPGLP